MKSYLLTSFAFVQNSTPVDTLTKSYSQKWDAASQIDQSGPIMAFMASNDLIFVVPGVSLIIWLVLLYTLFRVDRKVSALEDQVNQTNNSTH